MEKRTLISGEGKPIEAYELIAASAMISLRAQAVLMLVVDGEHGEGMALAAAKQIDLARLPEILRTLASKLESKGPITRGAWS